MNTINEMAINRLLTLAGATAIGLTMASGAVNASPIGDVGLGFGKFLGTWENTSGFDAIDSTMPNPTANTASVEQVGQAILFRYPLSFPIGEFNLAGAIDGYGGSHTNSTPANTGFRIESDGNAHTARWDYYGFPPGPAIPDVTPGMEPTELYVAVKYGGYTSVFLYDIVNPGEFGYISSDFAEILAHTNPVDYDYDALNYTNLIGTELVFVPTSNPNDDPANGSFQTQGCNVDEFSDICMPYNNSGNSAIGISHVTSYWPPIINNIDVPEPTSMTLLGAGLLGLGYLNRRRKAA